jgi:glycosyltransferase involved in cell wall biosynthesis
MPNGKLSIIIPTFNRKDVLLKTLSAYRRQSTADEILEIVVIDDGSSDGTSAALAELSRSSPIPIRYFHQRQKGAAAARNLGTREAKGELILFADDDIVPGPFLTAEHLRWHQRYPASGAAILGHVTWSPEVRPTPFMKWLGLEGPVFAYGRLARQTEVDFRYFYTCNLSLKVEFLRRNGEFDEEFKGCGYEDIELGYRLEQRGLRLFYNPDAIGYHYKYVSFADAIRRVEAMSGARRRFETTEAARRLAELTAQEHRSVLYRIGRALRQILTPALSPMTPLLDTRVPLPRIIYQLIYSCYCANAPERPDGSTRGRR